MNIKKCNMDYLKQHKTLMIRFIQRFGDKRITHHAIRWFKQLAHLDHPGTLIAVVTQNNSLIGLIVIGNYGLDEAFIAVHPKYRNEGVGEGLLRFTLQELPKVFTRVACDNTPSIKLCFSCGLIAYRLIKGPTGKPTLCFASGEEALAAVSAIKEAGLKSLHNEYQNKKATDSCQ